MSTNTSCSTGCPVKKTLSLFEGKYSAYILSELISGKQRFSALLKKIPGISSKTLNDKLKYYTATGIVTRRAYPEIPPRVEYELTEQGENLQTVIDSLYQFGSTVEFLNEEDEVKVKAAG